MDDMDSEIAYSCVVVSALARHLQELLQCSSVSAALPKTQTDPQLSTVC